MLLVLVLITLLIWCAACGVKRGNGIARTFTPTITYGWLRPMSLCAMPRSRAESTVTLGFGRIAVFRSSGRRMCSQVWYELDERWHKATVRPRPSHRRLRGAREPMEGVGSSDSASSAARDSRLGGERDL